MTDRCRSCGAEVVFAKVDGRTQILNKRRVRAYIAFDEEMTLLRDHHLEDAVGPDPTLVYVSHFLTCPNASSHSRSKT